MDTRLSHCGICQPSRCGPRVSPIHEPCSSISSHTLRLPPTGVMPSTGEGRPTMEGASTPVMRSKAGFTATTAPALSVMKMPSTAWVNTSPIRCSLALASHSWAVRSRTRRSSSR